MVLVEEDLELVHYHQDAGHWLSRGRSVILKILSACFLKGLVPLVHFLLKVEEYAVTERLECVESKKLDVWYPELAVYVEFYSALEIQQVQLQLVRPVFQQRANDDGMKEGGLARTCRSNQQSKV